MVQAEIGERKKLGRNDPCACGSGKKYKKCCIDSAERLDGHRVIDRNGERITDFAQPLLDATDGSPQQLQRALGVAMFFWDLALIREDEERERLLNALLEEALDGDEARDDLRAMANDMVERHRMMFPEMHEERRRA